MLYRNVRRIGLAVLMLCGGACVGCTSYKVDTTAAPLTAEQAATLGDVVYRLCDAKLKTLALNKRAIKTFPSLFSAADAAVPVVVGSDHESVKPSELVSTYNDLTALTLTVVPEVRPSKSKYKVKVSWPLDDSLAPASRAFEVNRTRTSSMMPWGWALRYSGDTPTQRAGSGSGSVAHGELASLSIIYSVAAAIAELKPEQRARFNDPAYLATVAMSASEHTLAAIAVQRIDDQKHLLKIAMGAPTKKIRAEAIARLKGPVQIQLLEQTKDWELRREIFGKMNQAQLETLSSSAKDPALRIAAEVRLGRRTWEQTFDASTLTGEGLGDALGAAALVDDPKPTPKTIVAACHKYIRKGDEKRIPELRNLLLRFGDRPLAEDYLNCGRKELADAGREWARKRGYHIRSGFGSSRVRWGSGR